MRNIFGASLLWVLSSGVLYAEDINDKLEKATNSIVTYGQYGVIFLVFLLLTVLVINMVSPIEIFRPYKDKCEKALAGAITLYLLIFMFGEYAPNVKDWAPTIWSTFGY